MPTSRRALAGGALSMHVAYFLAISCLGYGLLGVLKVREPGAAPRRIDRFFTAVSAATVSSMSTVEMEVFSNGQLVVLTVLMLLGGERRRRADAAPMDADTLRHNAVRALFYIVLAIFAVVHVVGAVAVAAYVLASPGARRTLGDKSLNTWTFAVFTTVSTFSNCGFMPTNENMVVFKRDAPLQLLLVPQVLAGNTLFAPLLAACVWAAAAATRREELVEMAREGGRAAAAGYAHLMPARRCWMLAATVAAFVAVLMALVCGMEWGGALQGMSPWEKVVNALFLAVNARHTGESTVDLSILAPAILVLFVLMMYLPPYTTWFPFEENSTTKDSNAENQGIRLLESTLLSQLSYLTIFVIAICITERRKLKEDPLNFSVLSIVVEVVRQVRLNGFLPEKKNADQFNPSYITASAISHENPTAQVPSDPQATTQANSKDLDLMFTSVSTAAVSSMATVEMEDFSNQQLWVLILLMILGGEVSISMLALHFNNAETNTNEVLPKRSPSTRRNIESFDAVNDSNQNSSQGFQSEATISLNWVQGSRTMKQKCRNMLAHIVTGYFIAAVVCSSLVIIIFAQIDSDTRQLLKSKDIKIWTFSIFTAVSSFANCGFTPVLAGNTILSPLLRLSIWILRKVSRREEYAYILQHPEDTGYRYYPSDNSALPINADNKPLTERGRNSNDQAIWKNFIISKSACLAIFTIIACITERKSISTDPLNFNIFSIAFKIISAYANVGYSLGYSCERLLKPDATCKATSYGFVGKWTDEAISTRAKTRAPRSGKCRAWKEGNYQEKRGCRGGRRRGRHGRALIGLVPVLGCAARRGAARRAEGDIVGGGKPSSHAPRQDRVQGDGHRARRRREERRRLPPPSSAVAADCSPSSGFPNDWA
ncbi:hypothetical protein OsJ_16090 [Oryza sativa Japonica Group]|uniref:Uncharacterized protein n=1 Tax=Oryza sativa subsp. japonica TaxID=39947 RepID=B9FCE0_ORYSJ|nr:hypothetical protein OsJ_16090 [Oryza sativa Japonica Group]